MEASSDLRPYLVTELKANTLQTHVTEPYYHNPDIHSSLQLGEHCRYYKHVRLGQHHNNICHTCLAKYCIV